MPNFKFLNVPLTGEEMEHLRRIAEREGRSMARQYRHYAIAGLHRDAERLGTSQPALTSDNEATASER